MIKSCVKKVISYGQAGCEIKRQLDREIEIKYLNKFEDAVIEAHRYSEPGDTILLSPACASYDQFSSFEERGDKFNLIFAKLELKL